MSYVDVAGTELSSALKQVIPHAAPAKDMIPGINTVRFEIVNGELVVLATDRYTLAVRSVERHNALDALPESFDVTVPLDDAKRVEKMAQDAKTLPVRLAVTDGRLRATSPGATIHAEQVDATFPAVLGLLAGAVEKRDATFDAAPRSYNPALLAKFKAGKGAYVTIFPAEKGGNVVTVGDNFVGLIMPVRQEGATVPPWAPGDPWRTKVAS